MSVANDAVAVDVITTAIWEAILPIVGLGAIEQRTIENALITAGLSLMIDRMGSHAAADAVASALIAMRHRAPIVPPPAGFGR